MTPPTPDATAQPCANCFLEGIRATRKEVTETAEQNALVAQLLPQILEALDREAARATDMPASCEFCRPSEPHEPEPTNG